MNEELYLSVFSEPMLKLNGKTVPVPPFPLLIAAYVIIEHQGETQKGYEVQNLFFPVEPVCPESFSELSKILYGKFWESSRYVQQENKVYKIRKEYIDESLTERERGLLNNLIQNRATLEQLKEYTVLAEETLSNDRYLLTEHFGRHIKNFELSFNHEKKEQLFYKNFSGHLGTIRNRLDEKRVPQRKKGDPVIVKVSSNINYLKIELEKALNTWNIKDIQNIYSGPFLENIEIKISRTWLSPLLRAWIYEKRQYFSRKVADALLCQVRRARDFNEVEEIKNFRTECQLQDERLEKAIAEVIERLKSTKGTESPTFPDYLRNHLLNKVAEKCDDQLSVAIEQWIDIDALVQKNSPNIPEEKILLSEISLPTQDAELLQQLLEKGYGFCALLGDAGMGKSLVLHLIAKKLIEQAKNNAQKPIPLIFNLADWDTKSLSFDDWLKQQLILLGIGERKVESSFTLLVEEQRCIFLLDSFDNLPKQQGFNSLQAIRDFARTHGQADLGGIIIASRPKEYELSKDVLLEEDKFDNVYFSVEVTLQTLKSEYVRKYIGHELSSHQLQIFNTLLAKSEELEERENFEKLLSIPFGLALLVKSIQEKALHDIKNLKTELIKVHVTKCFQKSVPKKPQEKLPYTQKETETWLSHLANIVPKGKAFHVEDLSPSNYSEKFHQETFKQKLQWKYQLFFTAFFSLIFGSMLGGAGGLIFGERYAKKTREHCDNCELFLPDFLITFHNTLNSWIDNSIFVEKLYLVGTYAVIGSLCALLIGFILVLLFKRIIFPIFLGCYLALFLGTTGWLVDGGHWGSFALIYYGAIGITLGYFVVKPSHMNSSKINLNYQVLFDFTWIRDNPKRIFLILVAYATLSSLSIFIMGKFIFSISSWAFVIIQGTSISMGFALGAVFYYSRRKSEWKKKQAFIPNQKIGTILKYNLSVLLITSTFIILVVTGIGLFYLDWSGSLSLGLRVGLPMGIAFTLITFGGVEILKYLALRFVLYRHGITPWNYTHFLEHAKKLTLLKQQSDGYAFQHDWFQEYFASQHSTKDK